MGCGTSGYVLWMKKRDGGVAFEIVGVESEQMRDPVSLHRRDETRVMYLFAFDVVNSHECQPMRQNV
jgi:hypothetical protein